VGLFISLLILVSLPFSHINSMKSNSYYPFSKAFFWVFVISFFMLTLGGAWPVEPPYVTVSQCFSVMYFFYFVGATPLRIG